MRFIVSFLLLLFILMWIAIIAVSLIKNTNTLLVIAGFPILMLTLGAFFSTAFSKSAQARFLE